MKNMRKKSLQNSFNPIYLIITLALVYTLLPLKQVSAEEAVPNLIGTWSGENKTISDKKGYKTWKKTINITEQKDRRFKGYFTYPEGRVNFFGVIYPDNKSITWVSSGSRGYNHGRLLSKGKISACFVESGIDATAGCAVLTKAK